MTKTEKQLEKIQEDFKCKYCSESGCDDGGYHELELCKLIYKKAKEDILNKIDDRLKHLRYTMTLHLSEEEMLIVENRINELEELKSEISK